MSALTDAVPAAAEKVGFLLRTYGPLPVLIGSDRSGTDGTSLGGTAPLYVWSFPHQSIGGSAAIDGDGSLRITGANPGTNAQVATATASGVPGGVKGIAFGGVGYFEAVLKFDGWRGQSSQSEPPPGGWPAFWAMAIEHLADAGAAQVSGMPAGYENFIEMDFMEYNIEHPEGTDQVYSGSLINWYGIYGRTCEDRKPRLCLIQDAYQNKVRALAEPVDFSDYHAYGALWVPATDSMQGYVQWYFDRRQIGKTVTWEHLKDFSSMPPSRFGIGDRQHLTLMLGTGLRNPMHVKSLSVWQTSAENNLIY